MLLMSVLLVVCIFLMVPVSIHKKDCDYFYLGGGISVSAYHLHGSGYTPHLVIVS